MEQQKKGNPCFQGIDVKATGEKIHKLREENHYTITEICSMIGVSPQAYYKWRHGRGLPTIDNLVVLSQLFQTPIDSLIVRNARTKEKQDILER